MANIVENNELIARFMGSQYVNIPFFDKADSKTVDFWQWTKPEHGYPRMVDGTELSTGWAIGNFHFHDSWDWLMPVVEKIESILMVHHLENGSTVEYRPMVSIWKSNCVVGANSSLVQTLAGAAFEANKLASVYNACIQFINWYNSQPKN